MTIREGDIRALLNKRMLEGKPLKSEMIIDGDEQVFYTIEKGRVRILERISTVLGVSQD